MKIIFFILGTYSLICTLAFTIALIGDCVRRAGLAPTAEEGTKLVWKKFLGFCNWVYYELSGQTAPEDMVHQECFLDDTEISGIATALERVYRSVEIEPVRESDNVSYYSFQTGGFRAEYKDLEPWEIKRIIGQIIKSYIQRIRNNLGVPTFPISVTSERLIFAIPHTLEAKNRLIQQARASKTRANANKHMEGALEEEVTRLEDEDKDDENRL